MYSPQGTVWLGTVPWTHDYKHVYERGFGNPQQVIGTFMSTRTDNYTYIRESTDIRVPYNADDLYGVNYCAYQNNGKWFFAFVNTISYVNNNTSLLHLEEDVWQTWGGNVERRQCLIERMHVDDDTLGKWRAPEPQISLEDCILSEDRFLNLSFDAVVIGTNAIPHLKDGGSIFAPHTEDDFDGSDAVSGGFYHKIYSGLKYYGFTSGDSADLSNFLINLNLAGAADSIACMFLVPSALIGIGSNHEVISYGSMYPTESYGAYQVSALGYSPRNNKCLTYPYCYFAVTDYNGGVLELKYEDCDTWGDVNLKFEQGLDATATLVCTAMNYQGQALDYHHSIVLSQNPQCAWVYSAYQNWVAQNASVQQVKQNINFLDLAIGGAMVAVGAALMGTGVGAPAGGALGAAGLTTMQAVGVGLAASGATKGVSAVTSEVSRQAEIEAQSKVPNHISGQSSSNSLQGIDRNMGGYMRVGLQYESAQRLDCFFDVFGYQIDRLMLPQFDGRKSWNYVKTAGANMGGHVPADRLAIINESLDSGVTFWHIDAVGDYSSDNTL